VRVWGWELCVKKIYRTRHLSFRTLSLPPPTPPHPLPPLRRPVLPLRKDVYPLVFAVTLGAAAAAAMSAVSLTRTMRERRLGQAEAKKKE